MKEHFFSQYGQDRLINRILQGKKGGVFLDIGAHDGLSLSNSAYFEKYKAYEGICIEANPVVFEKLIKNRKCKCLNKAVSNTSGHLDFRVFSGYTEMLSGLTDFVDSRHVERQKQNMTQYGGESKVIKIETLRLSDIEYLKGKQIDFLSLDTEGGEFEILESIDFKLIKINIVCCEINYPDVGDKIDSLMARNNYLRYATCGADVIYIDRQFSQSSFLKGLNLLLKLEDKGAVLSEKVGKLYERGIRFIRRKLSDK